MSEKQASAMLDPSRRTVSTMSRARELARLAAIMNDTHDAILAKTLEGVITDWNPAAERLYGYSASEAIGMPVARLFPPEREAEHENIMEHIRNGESVVHYDTVRLRKDGTPVPVSVTVSPLKDEQGAVFGASTIARDITERKRAEQELARLNTELEQRIVARTAALVDANQKLQNEIAERQLAEESLQEAYAQYRALADRIQDVREEERGRIARELHDELGQALTALKFDLAALTDRFARGNADLRDKIKSLSSQVDALVIMVRRISTELRPGMLDDLGLAATIEWQAQEFQARTSITCEVDMPAEDIELTREQSTALFRIFQETLTNVARHANATQVHVQMDWDAEALTMVVQDNGRGIALAELLGRRSLGLLGMRERAELLGGEFRIRGAPGEGTVVTVRIPLTLTERAEPQAEGE